MMVGLLLAVIKEAAEPQPYGSYPSDPPPIDADDVLIEGEHVEITNPTMPVSTNVYR